MNLKRAIISLALGAFLMPTALKAQMSGDSPELLQIIKNAGENLNKGDFDNAIALYKQAIRMSPDNIALRKDLAYTYLLKKDYSTARDVISQVVSTNAADAQCYQIAAAIEQADGKNAKAKRIINEGLGRFPNAGVLYNSKGNILIRESKSSKSALREWIQGIAVDPSFPTNYYNASRTLMQDGNYIWSIIYAEKFVNLESQSPKTVEIRKLLLDAYKNVMGLKYEKGIPDFSKAKQQNNSSKISFEDAFVHSINANISTVADGFNQDNISMLRTRFLIYWHNNFEDKFPQSIFSYQSSLLKNGFYPAYNQWLFGAAESSQDFSAWVSQFRTEYQKFEMWKKSNPYIPLVGDASIRL